MGNVHHLITGNARSISFNPKRWAVRYPRIYFQPEIQIFNQNDNKDVLIRYRWDKDDREYFIQIPLQGINRKKQKLQCNFFKYPYPRIPLTVDEDTIETDCWIATVVVDVCV